MNGKERKGEIEKRKEDGSEGCSGGSKERKKKGGKEGSKRKEMRGREILAVPGSRDKGECEGKQKRQICSRGEKEMKAKDLVAGRGQGGEICRVRSSWRRRRL